MPIYEYQCQSCGQKLEVIQRLVDPPPAACSACGGPLKKLVSSPAFQFKGSGWYATDYAGRGAGKGGEDSKGDTGKAGQSDKSEKSEKSDKTEKSEKSERSAEVAARAAQKSPSGGSSSGGPSASSGSDSGSSKKND